MSFLQNKPARRLQELPVPVALQLPSGQRLGAEHAAVALLFGDARSLANLVSGQIGALAEAMDAPPEGAGSEGGGGRAEQGPPLSRGEKDGLRLQIEACWNIGSLSREAQRTSVTVAFDMTPDGMPEQDSVRLLSAEGGSDAAAAQAFEAARRAILRCALQGDVIVEADAEVLDGGEADVVRDFGVSAARMMDHVASVVALAGWQDAAAVARRLRDELLEGRMEGAERRVTALRARLARSVSLRWSLRGLCPVTAEQQQRDGLPLHVVGDTHDRLLTMLQWAADALAGGDHRDETSLCPAQVSSLVTGLDLAAARLVVASFGLDGLTSRQESHAE